MSFFYCFEQKDKDKGKARHHNKRDKRKVKEVDTVSILSIIVVNKIAYIISIC